MRDDELPEPSIQDEFDEIEREDSELNAMDDFADLYDFDDFFPHWDGAV